MSDESSSREEESDELDPVEKLHRREATKEIFRVSRHRFVNDERLREGHLTLGVHDIPILTIIGEIHGAEVVENLKLKKSATSAEFVTSTLLYYEIAGQSVLAKFGVIENINRLTLVTEPYRVEHVAVRLLQSCSTVRELRKRADRYDGDTKAAELLAEVLQMSIWYHKVMVSLIERDSLHLLKAGAKLRSKANTDSHRRRKSMEIAKRYIQKRATMELGCSGRSVSEYVATHYQAEGDESPPARSTLMRWLKAEGIEIEK